MTTPPCITENQGHALALDFIPRDGKTHGFPYALMINYLLEKNQQDDKGEETPPEQLAIWFSTHDVVILGWRLDAVRTLLREGKIASVTARDPRYANLDENKPFVSEIIVTRVTEARA